MLEKADQKWQPCMKQEKSGKKGATVLILILNLSNKYVISEDMNALS